MQPRLKKSKKWTSFPEELKEQIRTAITENFGKDLKNSKVLVEGRIYPQEILLRVGYLESGSFRQKNFEVSCEYSLEKESAASKIYLAVDAAASLLLDYFEEEKSQDEDELLEPPLTWTKMDFEKQEVYFQFSSVNSELESEADKLLGSSKEGLLVDEEDDFEDSDGEEPRTEGSKKLH